MNLCDRITCRYCGAEMRPNMVDVYTREKGKENLSYFECKACGACSPRARKLSVARDLALGAPRARK